MSNTSTELEVLGGFHILGEWYHVSKSDEGFILLEDDGDPLTDSTTLDYQGNDVDEIICELYLRHYNSYQYKHSDFTCKEWLQGFEKAYEAGRRAGKKEKLGLIIEDLEKDFDNM